MKFKKIGKIHLIIIVSIALTIISAGMSKIPSTIDGVIKRPEPGENASSKYIDVIGGDGQQIATVNLAVSPRIMSFSTRTCFPTLSLYSGAYTVTGISYSLL